MGLYEKVERGTHRIVAAHFDQKKELLQAELTRQELAKRLALDTLEADCLKQYGAHEDDGSMFMGFCTRCGVSLG